MDLAGEERPSRRGLVLQVLTRSLFQKLESYHHTNKAWYGQSSMARWKALIC